MTAFVGTINTTGKNGESGTQYWAIGTYTLTGALANTDTITWTGLLPKTGDYKIVDVVYQSPELDTNASPTGTIIIGDGTDDDAYLTTLNVGLPAVAPANGSQIVYGGNGVSVGTNITTPVPNVVLAVTGVMATSATTGTIRVKFLLEGTN